MNALKVDVRASITRLPFRSEVFDCVTAVDVIEHIRRSDRKRSFEEMKRCGRKVIMHTPLQDGKVFQGRSGDVAFFNFVKKNFGRIERNTFEHIKHGEPLPNELEQCGFKIVKYDCNLTVWLTFMKAMHVFHVLLRPILILAYTSFLRHLKIPPYYGGYLMYEKGEK